MPPKTRPAKTTPATPAGAATEPPAALSPAPDNGQHYTAAGRAGGEPEHWGRKLSYRVPRDLYAQLEERAEQLGLPPQALIVRAMRSEVAGAVLPPDLLARLETAATKDGSTPERVLIAAVEAELSRRGA